MASPLITGTPRTESTSRGFSTPASKTATERFAEEESIQARARERDTDGEEERLREREVQQLQRGRGMRRPSRQEAARAYVKQKVQAKAKKRLKRFIVRTVLMNPVTWIVLGFIFLVLTLMSIIVFAAAYCAENKATCFIANFF